MTDGVVTLTYLFTDLESSTKLWERHPSTMPAALARHDEILADSVEGRTGTIVKTTGDGLMAVFGSPLDAVEASLEAQRTLQAERWNQDDPLRVRIGIHTGESTPRDNDFYGTEINKAARVMAAGHGGQVLLTDIVMKAVAGSLDNAEVKDLGSHRLKDLTGSAVLYQVTPTGLPDSFPPLSTLDLLPNNLPNQPSAFLGRETELAELRGLLRDEAVRMVTLTGPGGTGKTRLALQAAADRVDWFDDGVYFVDLSAQTEPDDAYRAIARTIDVDSGAEAALESLVLGIDDKSVLLVLDNFEQVTGAATGVARILRDCPRVQVLVTSREALRLRGEHVYSVAPLAFPDTGAGLGDIAVAPAVELFVTRARASVDGFSLNEENAAAVASICRRLDGLPLALELAAARLNLFTATDLDRKLETRLDLLRTGNRDLPERQQTLRSAIEWSVDLLSEPERALFSVFGRFRGAALEQVEAVVAELNIGIDPIDGLGSLVDKSLVRREDGPAGSARFRMLETLRAHALDLLASDPELDTSSAAALAAVYRRMAASTRDVLVGDHRHEALELLAADIDNLLGSWDYARARTDRDALNELLDPLWTLHEALGWYDGLVDLAEEMLELIRSIPPTPELVREEVALQTSVARAIMAVRGYTPEVEERFEAALRLSEEDESIPQRFPVLRSLASIYFSRTEHEKGADLGRQLVAMAETEGDPSLLSEAHYILGSNLVMLNDVPGGLEHLGRSIELFDPAAVQSERFRLGPSPGVVALTTSAFVRLFSCEFEQATELAERAILVATELEHPLSLAYAHYHVGLMHLWRTDLPAAQRHASALASIADLHDYDLWRSLALVVGGICRAAFGEAASGVDDIDQGVQIYLTLKTPPGFTLGLFMLRATGLAMAGRPEEGLQAIEDALVSNPAGVDTPYQAMAHMLIGDMLLGLRPPDPGAAEDHYRRAYGVASELGVLMPELMAATRLVQVRRGTAGEQETRTLLKDAYDRIREGFDEPIVMAARAELIH